MPLKTKKEKKPKKLKKALLPVWTGGQVQQTESSVFINLAVRFALLCAAGAGVSLLLIQTYNMPVDTGTVIMWSVWASLVFNTALIFLKRRYIFLLLAVIGYLYWRSEDVLFNLGCFADYMLVSMDGGLLNTASYASRPSNLILYEMPLAFQQGLQKSVILITVALAFLFALSARGKFIGSILITGIIFLIPSIASQKATYVPAMTILAVSMLGLYSIWASQEQSYLKENKLHKRAKGPFLPKIHRYSVNGALTAVLALIACVTANNLLPREKTPEIIEFWASAADSAVELGNNIGEALSSFGSLGSGFGIPSLDHSGYMPSGGLNASGTMSINNPSLSKREAFIVTLEDGSNPVYLRNGIGTVFNADRGTWDVGSRGNRMSGFPDNFYPEHEYLVFRQKAGSLSYDTDRFMNRQRVKVESLVRSQFVLLPTSPYFAEYKTDARFNWNHDSILTRRGSTAPQTYEWDVMYPVTNSDYLHDAIYTVDTFIANLRPLTAGDISSWETLSGGGEDYGFIEYENGGFPNNAVRLYTNSSYGMSAAEYLSLIQEYEEMVFDVYTQTTPSEYGNMEKLADEAVGLWGMTLEEIGGVNRGTNGFAVQAARVIENYFKTEYTYSLVVDNNAGPNTMLGNFLFETHEGHCALYATAMTLLLREMDIPARYVTGYVAGGGTSTGPSWGNYTQTILERDLHAWVEVYLRGVGWIPFDPTPPIYEYYFLEAERERGDSGAATTTTTPRTTPPTTTTTTAATTTPPVTTSSATTLPGGTTSSEPAITEPDEMGRLKSTVPIQVLFAGMIIVLGGVLIGSVVMFTASVSRVERRKLLKYTGVATRDTARQAYRFILKLLKTDGFTVMPGEVPVKFAERVDEAVQKQELSSVIDIIRKLEFSREELTAEEYTQLGLCAGELYKRIVSDKKALKRFARKVIVLGIVK